MIRKGGMWSKHKITKAESEVKASYEELVDRCMHGKVGDFLDLVRKTSDNQLFW